MIEKLTPEERLNFLYAYVKYDDRNLNLDFWQEDFIRSTKQFIAILKSRRTGFSFATALKGMSKAQDPGRMKYTKQFVSYNESDALEKIRYAQEFYDSIPSFARKKIVTDNKAEIEILDANGKTTSRLISMPCKPPRGKGGDISLDEFGIFTPELSKQIYTAALYVIARGGTIEVGSTPLGCVGRFYEICTDKQKYPGYQRFNVPWWFSSALCTNVEEAVKVAGAMNTLERVEKYATETLKEIFNNDTLEDFQQECECAFVDSAESYITLEEIYGCTPGRSEYDGPEEIEENTELLEVGETEEKYFGKEIQIYKSIDDMVTLPYEPEKHGVLFLGYDVAKRRDAASILLLGVLPDGRKRIYGYEELRAQKFEFQLDCVRKLMKNLPIRKGAIDATGMGAPIAEKLQTEFPAIFDDITFNVDIKEQMAQGIKIGLQKKEFLLPNEKRLHHQIHSIRRIATSGGHFRYDADRDENGHADTFWAFALANLASKNTAIGNFYSRWRESHPKEINGKVINSVETKTTTRTEKNVIPKGKTLRQVNKAFGY